MSNISAVLQPISDDRVGEAAACRLQMLARRDPVQLQVLHEKLALVYG